MKNTMKTRKVTLAAFLLTLTLFACGGSPTSASTKAPGDVASGSAGAVTNPGTDPKSSASSPVADLIAKRYSSSPELQRAAEGFAKAMTDNMANAQSTGVYNESLSMKESAAQMCLYSRAKRLGNPVTRGDLQAFLAATTSTPETFRAYIKADSLSSGHAERLTLGEPACVLAGIE